MFRQAQSTVTIYSHCSHQDLKMPNQLCPVKSSKQVVLVLVYESEIEEAITVLLAVLYFYLTSSVGVKTIPQAIM